MWSDSFKKAYAIMNNLWSHNRSMFTSYHLKNKEIILILNFLMEKINSFYFWTQLYPYCPALASAHLIRRDVARGNVFLLKIMYIN